MIAKRAKQTFCAILGIISLLVTLFSLVKFILFISKPMEHVTSSGSDEWKVAVRHLLHNSIFVVVFILQHSFQRHPKVKLFWEKIGLKLAERLVYNLVSALILLVSIARRFSLFSLILFCIIATCDAQVNNSIAAERMPEPESTTVDSEVKKIINYHFSVPWRCGCCWLLRMMTPHLAHYSNWLSRGRPSTGGHCGTLERRVIRQFGGFSSLRIQFYGQLSL